MGILLRYIRKNMMEKKSRLILVVLSVAISAGLLVTCMGLMNTISDSFTEPGRKAAEGRDVALSAVDGFWFTEDDFDGDGLTQLMEYETRQQRAFEVIVEPQSRFASLYAWLIPRRSHSTISIKPFR